MFDQLNLMSMNKELLNDNHLKSIGNFVKIVTVGQSPFIQTNTPHRFRLSEIWMLSQSESTKSSGQVLFYILVFKY